MPGVNGRAVACRHVESVEQILDRDRQAVQQTGRGPRIERTSACDRPIGVDQRPCVDGGFALRDAREAVGEQRFGRDLARCKLARRGGRA